MHSLISLPFHTADWAVLFSVIERKGAVPDLCGLRIALRAEAPTTYWKIMEFQIGKSQVSLYVYFLCAKLIGKMLTLIRLDCTICTYNHGCYTNSEAGGTKESLS